VRGKHRAAEPLWLLALALWACGPPSSLPTGPAGRVVQDGLGREVRIPAVTRRLVALAPSVTETILALGMGDRLVGVSEFSTLPAGLSGVRRVGGLLNPDLEIIRALRPDLLIGTTSGNDPELARQADGLGLPLYILHADDVGEVLTGIGRLADALGEPERGQQVVGDLQHRLAMVARRVEGHARPRTLFVIWGDPLIVPGARAFLTDAIRLAGGESVTAGAPAAHAAYSIEAAIAAAPGVILTTSDNADIAERLRTDPAWAAVPAVRQGKVFVVGDAVVRPGPGVVTGIEDMARRLHPEAYAAVQPDGRP
jgi:iron complex transport system substrate-binding protein